MERFELNKGELKLMKRNFEEFDEVIKENDEHMKKYSNGEELSTEELTEFIERYREALETFAYGMYHILKEKIQKAENRLSNPEDGDEECGGYISDETPGHWEEDGWYI